MLDHYHRGVDGAVVLGVGLGLPYAFLGLVDEALAISLVAWRGS